MAATQEVQGRREVQESQIDNRVREPEQSKRVGLTQQVLEVPQAKPLFSDILLETDDREKRRRGIAAVLSMTFEVMFLAILLMVPLIYTDALPKQQLLTFLVAPTPPPPPPPPAPAVARVVRHLQSNLWTSGQLRAPIRIPSRVEMIHEDESPPAVGGVMGGVPGGIPGGQLGGVIDGIVNQTANLAAIPKFSAPAIPKRVRISQGVTRGQLTYKIEPDYPKLALAARIQGQVLLKAIVSKDGSTRELEVVNGHPMLSPAALKAVQQWRYRPFLLNGEPVEVETSVTVIFQIPN